MRAPARGRSGGIPGRPARRKGAQDSDAPRAGAIRPRAAGRPVAPVRPRVAVALDCRFAPTGASPESAPGGLVTIPAPHTLGTIALSAMAGISIASVRGLRA